MPQPIQLEGGSVESLDQAGDHSGLTGISGSEKNGAPDIAIALQIGRDGRNHHAGNNRPPRRRTKPYQYTGGYTRSRPEYGDAVGLSQKGQA